MRCYGNGEESRECKKHALFGMNNKRIDRSIVLMLRSILG